MDTHRHKDGADAMALPTSKIITIITGIAKSLGLTSDVLSRMLDAWDKWQAKRKHRKHYKKRYKHQMERMKEDDKESGRPRREQEVWRD